VIAAEKSADGIVGGTSFAEGPNAGKTLGFGNLESATRLNSRSLAFSAAGKGEARTALLEGAEASTTKPTI
jgi:hypothetical protein